MDTLLTQYELLTRIHNGLRSVVHRGRRKQDGAPVVIKIPRGEHPSPAELARFRREHEIVRGLPCPGVIRALDLARYRDRTALVMEDVGAESVRSFAAAHRLDPADILAIGADIATILADVHARRVVHKDVNPSNVVIQPDTRAVYLIDFGIASTLLRESPALVDANVIEGTLRYISPEQTGRMNRAVDYRTDFYSLGVMLYELLSGAPPFLSEEPMTLVHCHIAREAVPLHVVRPDLPRAVSDVVEKLLAKTAEDRYQSGRALAADLRACSAALRGEGSLSGFVPGKGDVAARIQIAQKLYGRAAQIAALLQAFDRAADGPAELVLVTGQPGIGKSVLVNEVQKPLVERRGYFTAGKFDQLKRDVPYASLIEAFSSLIEQILAESEARLGAWRRQLEAGLGNNADVIAEMIPAVRLILGERPAAATLPPTEAENRRNHAFERFVRAIAAGDRPLVLFLDDLQWADTPSLKLLETLLTDPEIRHLAVFGAYRSNEVGGAHPLVAALDAVRAAGRPVTTIELDPLDAGEVTELVQDALRSSRDRAAPLAALVHQKTAGNPFFIGQMLTAMHDDGLITLDEARAEWRWDLDAIRARGFTDNVIELMVGRLHKLPAEAQEALTLAACIGNRFELAMLATVSRRSPAAAAHDLWPAVEEGLVLPLGGAHRTAHPAHLAEEGGGGEAAFRFLHDRVQQAAYELIPPARRPDIHHEIARLLLAGAGKDGGAEALFDLVHQFELGRARVTERAERIEVARLALQAGRKAMASAAWEPARRHLDLGLGLLPEGAADEDRELVFELHLAGIEAASLTADLDRAEALSAAAMALARSALERAAVLELSMGRLTIENRLEETVRTGLEALRVLGVPVPADPGPADFGAALAKNAASLAGRRVEDLAALPRMTDPNMLEAMRVFCSISGPALRMSPLLWLVLTCEQLDLCIAHGNSPLSPVSYASMVALHGGVLGDIGTAGAYGRLALELQEAIGVREHAASSIGLVALFSTPWVKHLRESIRELEEAGAVGVETGDMEHAGYDFLGVAIGLVMVGEPLATAAAKLERYFDWFSRHKQRFSQDFCAITQQVVENLLGRAADPRLIVGARFDEDRMIPELLTTKNTHSVYVCFAMRAMLAYLHGDPALAAASAQAAEPYEASQRGQIITALHCFYQALALLALARDAAPDERREQIERADKNLAQLRAWAEHAPQNYQHKARLVEAERARIEGDVAAAVSAYEDAIRGAARHGYIQEEALAAERCADLCRSLGWISAADAYLANAHHGYLLWGAAAKVAELERRHPELTSRGPAVAAPVGGIVTLHESSTRHGGAALELGPLMKAARAVSGEIVLDRLLRSLMGIMIEIAGAQRGFLLLAKEGRLLVEAEWTTDGELVTRRSTPLEAEPELSAAIVQYAARTGESVVLKDAAVAGAYVRDRYVAERRPRSVLCAPLVHQGQLTALVYLENNLTAGAFTADRLEALRLLGAQAALSIQNANHYATLEEKVATRTQELSQRNQELDRALRELEATQQQLVTQEKLASLGALTAGIAHELKNPLNFITNFAQLATDLSQQIGEIVGEQRRALPVAAVHELDDLLGSLEQGVRKIDEHGRRANDIINGMLLHARDASGERGPADLNAILSDSLESVESSARAKHPDLPLHVERDLDASLGPIDVVSGDIRRVFVNVIDNALYAMRERRRSAGQGYVPTLRLRTVASGDRVVVRIRDNGAGIDPRIAERIYHPFFTTKPAGQGMGLGLSLSHEIIVKGHGGDLRMESVPGEHTEFVISLPRGAARA